MAISQVKVTSKIERSFKVEVDASHSFIIDQPVAGGGKNQGPNPLEVFLASLSSCICTIGRIVANQKRIKLRSIEAEVEGDIDKDFLIGLTDEGRAGFTEIRSKVKIDADLTEEEKLELLNEINRRCPIGENIMMTTPMICELV